MKNAQTQNPETVLPKAVYDSLTEEQADEFDKTLLEMSLSEGLRYPFDKLRSSNPGIQYLLLLSPIKYSLVQMPHISEDALLELISFDFSRLDTYHKLMWGYNPVQGLWEQRFSTVMASLGNPNLSEATVDILLDELQLTDPEDTSPAELMELVGDQLLDKWTPDEFNSEVLLALVKRFELLGCAEYLPKFKRLQRRAAKREDN